MQKNMFKNTYKSLLYLSLLSIPLTAKPALADKNNISICQGNTQQILFFSKDRQSCSIAIGNFLPEVVDILLDPVENLGLEQQLQQGQWLLEDLGGRGVIDNLQTKLKFDSQGRISGLAGCNSYFGQYKLNGENLKISNIASTRKACSEAVANQESLFLNALERAYQIRIDGPYLLIYSKGLKQPLKFTLLY